MADIQEQLKKLQFQVRLMGETIDFTHYPIPALAVELNWNERDLTDANKIFNDYEKRLISGKDVSWTEFNDRVCDRFHIVTSQVKSVVLAFLRNNQWLEVCKQFAEEYNIKEFQEILELNN